MEYYQEYAFGVDQTKPGVPFIRMFESTDLDKVVGIMLRHIRDYHGGVDLLNPGLWMEIGIDGGPVRDYLLRVMDIERSTKTSMTAQNAPEFNTRIQLQYGTNPDHLIDFSRAYVETRAAGEVPASILMPWDYTATSVSQDIGSGLASGAKSFGPLILGAVAVYALVSAFLPNLVGKVLHR